MAQQSNSGLSDNQPDNRHDGQASDPGCAGMAKYQQPIMMGKGSQTLRWQGREPDLKGAGYRGSEMPGCGGNDAEGNY